MSRHLVLIAALAIAAGSLIAQAPGEDDDDPDPKVVERLVNNLGSDEFQQREAAMVELRKIGDPAIVFLRRKQNSPDAEIRRRSLDLLNDIEKNTQRVSCTGPESAVSIALLPGDQKVLAAGVDNAIRLWDLTDGKLLRRFDGHAKQVWAVAISPDGKSFVSSGQDAVVRWWNLDGEPKSRVLATLPDSGRCLCYSRDGTKILAGVFDKKIHVIDARTGKIEASWPGHHDSVLCLAISPDGARVLSGGGYLDASVCVRDAKTGEILQRLVGHREYVYAVAFVGNDRGVSAGHDNIIRLWDLKTGKIVRELKGHAQSIYALAVSADGKRLLSGAHDKQIRLWDLATGDELRRYHHHEAGINALAFTANGRFAVSAGEDRTVRVCYLPRVKKK